MSSKEVFSCQDSSEYNIKKESFCRPDICGSVKEILSLRKSTSDLRADISQYFSNIYPVYFDHGLGALDLLADFHKIKGDFVSSLPVGIDDQLNSDDVKRHPKLVESIEATLSRFSKLEELQKLFGDKIEGIILGGSLSYGPFYNVRENLDKTGGSDIDLILVTSLEQLSQPWDFINKIRFFSEDNKKIFLSRQEYFLQLYDQKVVEIFSKKFSLTDSDLEISMHIFPKDVFLRMIGEQFSIDLSQNKDCIQIIHDYKDNHFPHLQCNQRSFSGKTYSFMVPVESVVDNGRITSLPGYIIHDSEFFPGIYQNLISPMFSVYMDNSDLTFHINKFKGTMLARLNYERQIHPEDRLRFSHIRSGYFSSSLNGKLDQY